jgi:hypothetical protein
VLRRAEKAEFAIWTRGVFRKREVISFTTGKTGFRFERAEYERILEAQQSLPQLLAAEEGRQYWIFKDRFYWDNDELTAEEVRLLLLERERRRAKQIERARAHSEGLETPQRQSIPDEVKLFVWQRDGGKCIRCATDANLEFDHIIPLTMGGSNTARNIQLLCQDCNRAKGGNLA